jgi:PAS domain-containing protein
LCRDDDPTLDALFTGNQLENESSVIDTFMTSTPLMAETTFSTTERYIILAADPPSGSSYDKFLHVMAAKYEAGMIQPYNYVNGYTRLLQYIEQHASPTSRQRILTVLGMFRPAFRQVAHSLNDMETLLIEEHFERLLLEYDRVFCSMGVASCLWRRTGEIFKGNREFSQLVGLSFSQLRDGQVCIYQLMDEESMVNYWEKYGQIAFDATQKAVLTMCTLRNAHRHPIQCCFSFTVRRDKYDIPIAIIGNFIPVLEVNAS